MEKKIKDIEVPKEILELIHQIELNSKNIIIIGKIIGYTEPKFRIMKNMLKI
jgi:hypothetical protein